jgi:hypothetical protein
MIDRFVSSVAANGHRLDSKAGSAKARRVPERDENAHKCAVGDTDLRYFKALAGRQRAARTEK